MTPEEIRATGRLVVQVYAGTVSHIEKAHKRVASRVFRLVASESKPFMTSWLVWGMGPWGVSAPLSATPSARSSRRQG
jgi:hypothetical protein